MVSMVDGATTVVVAYPDVDVARPIIKSVVEAVDAIVVVPGSDPTSQTSASPAVFPNPA